MPTDTLAGAPPGAFLKAGASASDTPATVGTKSINISPKQTTSDLVSLHSPFELPAKKQYCQTHWNHRLNNFIINDCRGIKNKHFKTLSLGNYATTMAPLVLQKTP